MNQAETRSRLIAKEILLSLLRDGEIPSGEKIAKLLSQRTSGIVLSQPEIAQIDNQFAYREASSASKMNNVTRTISADIAVLLQSYLENEKQYIEYLEKTLGEMEFLRRKVRSLTSRAERMLLVTDRTEGLLETFADDFADLSLVDTERSTVEIDIESQSVYLGYDFDSPIYHAANLNTAGFAAGDITVSPLNQTSRRAPGTRDSTIMDIFTSSRHPWIYTLSDPSNQPVSIEVKINFSNATNPRSSDLATRKIKVDPFISGGSILLTVQHSQDGILWTDLPVQEPTRRIAAPTVFMTGDLSFKWLRLIITKDTHSSINQLGVPLYDFGIRNIEMESVANRLRPEAVFYSLPLFSLGEDGQRKGIRAATLSLSCENVEVDTEIDYDIIFVDDEEEESTPKRVVPTSRRNAQGARIAEFDQVQTTRKTSLMEPVGEVYSGSSTAANRLLDVRVGADELRIWRNRGRNNRYYLIRDINGSFVEDGWAFVDGLYQTYILVDQPGGREIDFGPAPIWIDGQRVSGNIRLAEGVHQCQVRPESWYSLEGLTNITAFNPLTKAFTGTKVQYGSTINLDEDPTYSGEVVVDRLYPYNHKLLLEGLTYGDAFRDLGVRQKYQGGIYAAHYPFFLSENDFNSRAPNSEYNAYTRVKLSSDEDSNKSGVVVKWTGPSTESSREEFLVIEHESNKATAVILKATLRTRNPNRSPSLDGYQIRVIS